MAANFADIAIFLDFKKIFQTNGSQNTLDPVDEHYL